MHSIHNTLYQWYVFKQYKFYTLSFSFDVLKLKVNVSNRNHKHDPNTKMDTDSHTSHWHIELLTRILLKKGLRYQIYVIVTQ